MTIDTRPLEVDDFTGGITDYTLDGPQHKAEEMDNFFYIVASLHKLFSLNLHL